MKQACMMINLHVVNYTDELGEKLIRHFYENALPINADIKIELFSVRPYWKYTEETECIFVVKSSTPVDVEDFVASFPSEEINFSELPAYNCIENDGQTFAFQQAIWSKNVSSQPFFDEHVVWAHVYTWDSSWQQMNDELDIPEQVLQEMRSMVDDTTEGDCADEDCEEDCSDDESCDDIMVKAARYDDEWQDDEDEEEISDDKPLPIIPCEDGKVGFIDQAKNAWMYGPTQARGEFFEWDVLMSEEGKQQWRQFSPDGVHVSVNFDGQPTT